MNRTIERRSRRNTEVTTVPAPTLPNMSDPIWRLGRDVVDLLIDYVSDLPTAVCS